MSADLETVAAGLETITIEFDAPVDHCLTVVFDRPEARNAMNQQLRDEFAELAETIKKSDVRVIVLTGSDDSKSFVAGADVSDLQDRPPLEQRQQSAGTRIYDRVEALPQPVVARINGFAFGGGCELAMACDVRVAHEDALLGLPEVGLGLIPGGGGTQRLPRLVGQGQAMRLILTGDPVPATEAKELGLVDVVSDPDDLDKAVGELASSMAENSPVALRLAKRAVQASGQLGIEDGIEYETELFTQALGSKDSTEGIAAFLEDREPKWEGR
ncbi:enoyl-CoA hydratase/isomerase family protein [Halosolutus halophilus]|uniref:enoyl-CoA hydratase/isomerase family protein n=1 Tax=Halosolutus halophilus TaxID=1552990 RepID=UPI002235147F|nr:enoyl-CoA hydratase-related protein [Halosolutus halophilus]